MSVHVKKIRFKNIQSFGNQWSELNFDKPGTTLIVGENVDAGGSSGAGKSTALSALSWAIYDKLPSGVSKDAIVNSTNAKKNAQAEVELYFEKDSKQYIIKRSRGSSSSIKLLEDDKDITLASLKHTNGFIEELFGFSYKLFSQLVMFSGNNIPFLELSVGDQRGMIEELFKITLLSKKAEALKKDVSIIGRDIDLKKQFIEQKELRNTEHTNRIQSSQARFDKWVTDQQESMLEVVTVIAEIDKINFEVEEECHKEIKVQQAQILKHEGHVKDIENLMVINRREKPEGYEQVEVLKMEISNTKNAPIDGENQLSIVKSQIESKSRELPEGRTECELIRSRLASKKNEKPEGQNDVINIDRLITETQQAIVELDGEIEHLKDSNCPYCKQSYAEAETQRKVKETRVVELKASIVSLVEEKDFALEQIEINKKVIEDDITKLSKDLEVAEKTVSGNLRAIKNELVSLEETKTSIELVVEQGKKIREEAVKESESKLNELMEFVKTDQKRIDDDHEQMIIDRDEQLIDILNIKDSIAELKSLLNFNDIEEMIRNKASRLAFEQRLTELKEDVNPHKDTLDSLEAEGFIDIQILKDELDSMVNLETHQKFMVKLLTDKNSYVRKNLISTTTPYLNERISGYLEKLNIPHLVTFEADMSCKISQLGRPIGHGSLSSGEKKRLNFALSLAFRDVLTYLHSKVNVLFTDEIDGGSICPTNINFMIRLLREKAREDNISIYSISHSPDFDGRLDNTITIRKEKGFSSIV